MEIHELNTFSGTLGANDYFVTDNGSDTSKVPATGITDPLNARIDNIIAGGTAPSAAEVTDARLGATVLGGVQYTSLGAAIRGQATELYNDTIDLKTDLVENNCSDLFLGLMNKSNVTSHGLTFTWSGDTCSVTGASDSYAADSLINDFLPSFVKPGSTYYLKFTTSDIRVRLRIIWRTSNNTEISTIYATGDMNVTVPSNTAKWNVSLFVGPNISFSSAVVISNVKLLTSSTNSELTTIVNYLNGNSLVTKGVLPSGTDLNDVMENGIYVLQSSNIYTNTPLPGGYAGILTVFAASANSVLQEVVTIDSVPKTYVRTSLLGAWPFGWANIGGSGTYNNYYTSEHYDNVYNITCTPEITADTNNYLASTGDNTDRTGDIQTMLNSTGVCHLGPGKFVVSGIDVPDYASLIGSGLRTVIVLDSTVNTGYAVKLNNYSSVSDMRINGGSTAQGTSSVIGTRHGVLFEGTKASGQSGGVTKKKSTITRCTINNFSGGGITLTGTGVDIDSNVLISDCFVDHCGAGINIAYYSEFHRISNCAFTYNWYGCIDNGGNNNFANCDFSGNKVGVLIDNSTGQSPNNSHGSFVNCSINHSYSSAGVMNEGTALKLLSANLGEIFSGMQIFYGAIVLDDCVGVRFIGANVGSKVPITISDSTVVTFSDCTFKEAPTSTDSPFVKSGNTVLKFTDCYLRNGTVYDPA